jgi:hypothetical protein
MLSLSEKPDVEVAPKSTRRLKGLGTKVRILLDDRVPVDRLKRWEKEVASALKKVHPDLHYSLHHVKVTVPRHAPHSSKRQSVWRASLLIEAVGETAGFAQVLLTNRIMSSVKPNRPSATLVHGKAHFGRGVCVVSSTGESLDTNTVLHELGHLFGLPHCCNVKCLMCEEQTGEQACASCQDAMAQAKLLLQSS